MAIWLRLRAEWRVRWRGVLALALLAGIAGGVVVAAAAGARRTEGACPRFLRAYRAGEFDVGIPQVGRFGFIRSVARLPGVVEAAPAAYVFMAEIVHGRVDETGAGIGQPLVPLDTRWLRTLDQPKILQGRPADPGRADEVTINQGLATDAHLSVGDRVEVKLLTPKVAARVLTGAAVAPDGPVLTLRVVGIDVVPGELFSNTTDNAIMHLTVAFFHRYGRMVGLGARLYERLADHASRDGFVRSVERLSSGQPLSLNSQQAATAKTQRSIRLQADALWLFAALAALVSVLMVGQALARRSF